MILRFVGRPHGPIQLAKAIATHGDHVYTLVLKPQRISSISPVPALFRLSHPKLPPKAAAPISGSKYYQKRRTTNKNMLPSPKSCPMSSADFKNLALLSSTLEVALDEKNMLAHSASE